MPIARRFGFALCAFLLALAARAQNTLPATTQSLPAQSLAPGAAPVTLDLKNYFALPGVTGSVAQFDTVLGKFNIELFTADTPKTAANFLSYANAGLYRSTIIHRSVPGFVIQGGGYSAAVPPVKITSFPPVQNEYRRSNLRGTLAMAKLGGDPNSATSEWFVNLADNSGNLDNQNGGFTVFARVLGTGMTVVDAIVSVPIFNVGAPFDTIPLRNVAANQTSVVVANYITINSVTALPVYPEANGAAAVLSFTAVSANPAIATATLSGTALTLTAVAPGETAVTVRATDTNGNAATAALVITVAAATAPPKFAAQPQSARVAPGSTAVFTALATGAPAPSYQWTRNGTPLPAATNALLVIRNATAADAATYACVATNRINNADATDTSAAVTLTLTPTADPGRLINLSIITPLAAGEQMSMGTVLGGAGTSGAKAVLARAVGPSLGAFGVPGTLPDPKMTLVATGTTNVNIATNDNWAGDAALSNAFAQVGAFAYANATTRDAAVFQPALAPGNYAVQVSDATTTASGTILAEIYDATPTASFTATTPRLINVSVIKNIATGGALSAGFVIGGTTAKTVLVRALGPGLGAFGVAGTMPDPKLDLLLQSTGATITSNDNWGGDAQLAAVSASVGAFAIASPTSADAVLLVTLAPGSYAARVQPTATGGTALVEVYEVP